jgi:hypothetical protein
MSWQLRSKLARARGPTDERCTTRQQADAVRLPERDDRGVVTAPDCVGERGGNGGDESAREREHDGGSGDEAEVHGGISGGARPRAGADHPAPGTAT